MTAGSSLESELRLALAEADRTLVGSADAPADPHGAACLYADAAARGSGSAAARLAMIAGVGVGRSPNWDEALDRLLEAALLDDRGARRQLAVLAGATESRVVSGEATSSALWKRLREGLDVEALLTPGPIRWLSNAPKIGVIKGFATPAICNWLVRRSGDLLAPGRVNDAQTGETRAHAMRTALSASYNVLQRDVVLAVMQARAARATGLAVSQHEPPNVIRYDPGQEFSEHFDFIDPKSVHFREELELLG